jgi:SAM-dependent methyltransferase
MTVSEASFGAGAARKHFRAGLLSRGAELPARAVIDALRAHSLRLGRSLVTRLAARHPVWVSDLIEPVRGAEVPSDPEGFVELVYAELLGRPPDDGGRRYFLEAMRAGMHPSNVVMAVATSEEYRALCRQTSFQPPGGGPRHRRPERYSFLYERSLWMFGGQGDEDFDWLEAAIIGDGYYEHPGVWGFQVDLDKRVMAEIVGSLGPGPVLEIGCANGAVLEGLYEQGIPFVGVDISRMALGLASERVKPHICLGDLLQVDVGEGFGTVFGLDIFEHLNPNRLAKYLSRVASLLTPGGMLFANIPAFGYDEVFGEVFPYYLPGWELDNREGRCFRNLHTDEAGYPIHGHLVWADTRWWEGQFELAGFTRRIEIERALHAKYGEYLRADAPARQSFYVMSLGEPVDELRVIRFISDTPSSALADWAAH